jgi:hypothetical protein
MASNSKNDDEYQFARPRSTWKPNFAQIRGFLYFGGHFGFFSTPQKLPHTTVDIPTKFHEV